MTEGRALALLFAAVVLATLGLTQLLKSVAAPGEAYSLVLVVVVVAAAGPASWIVGHYAPERREAERARQRSDSRL